MNTPEPRGFQPLSAREAAAIDGGCELVCAMARWIGSAYQNAVEVMSRWSLAPCIGRPSAYAQAKKG